MVQNSCDIAPPAKTQRFHRQPAAVLATALFLLPVLLPLRVAAQQVPSTQAAEPAHSFEVAAIKPSRPGDRDHRWNDTSDRVSIENYTLRRLISVAYGLKSESQVMGGPAWVNHESFDIVAKIDDTDVARMHQMSREGRGQERELMLQSLLEDRFGLKIIRGERKLPVFVLLVSKSGAKITPSMPDDNPRSELSGYNGAMTAFHISMDDFAHDLGTLDEVAGQVVLNRTGLVGNFDFTMNFTRDHGAGVPLDAQYPGLFTALRDQLGLELRREKATIPVVIVGSATRPVFD